MKESQVTRSEINQPENENQRQLQTTSPGLRSFPPPDNPEDFGNLQKSIDTSPQLLQRKSTQEAANRFVRTQHPRPVLQRVKTNNNNEEDKESVEEMPLMISRHDPRFELLPKQEDVPPELQVNESISGFDDPEPEIKNDPKEETTEESTQNTSPRRILKEKFDPKNVRKTIGDTDILSDIGRFTIGWRTHYRDILLSLEKYHQHTEKQRRHDRIERFLSKEAGELQQLEQYFQKHDKEIRELKKSNLKASKSQLWKEYLDFLDRRAQFNKLRKELMVLKKTVKSQDTDKHRQTELDLLNNVNKNISTWMTHKHKGKTNDFPEKETMYMQQIVQAAQYHLKEKNRYDQFPETFKPESMKPIFGWKHKVTTHIGLYSNILFNDRVSLQWDLHSALGEYFKAVKAYRQPRKQLRTTLHDFDTRSNQLNRIKFLLGRILKHAQGWLDKENHVSTKRGFKDVLSGGTNEQMEQDQLLHDKKYQGLKELQQDVTDRSEHLQSLMGRKEEMKPDEELSERFSVKNLTSRTGGLKNMEQFKKYIPLLLSTSAYVKLLRAVEKYFSLLKNKKATDQQKFEALGDIVRYAQLHLSEGTQDFDPEHGSYKKQLAIMELRDHAIRARNELGRKLGAFRYDKQSIEDRTRLRGLVDTIRTDPVFRKTHDEFNMSKKNRLKKQVMERKTKHLTGLLALMIPFGNTALLTGIRDENNRKKEHFRGMQEVNDNEGTGNQLSEYMSSTMAMHYLGKRKVDTMKVGLSIGTETLGVMGKSLGSVVGHGAGKTANSTNLLKPQTVTGSNVSSDLQNKVSGKMMEEKGVTKSIKEPTSKLAKQSDKGANKLRRKVTERVNEEESIQENKEQVPVSVRMDHLLSEIAGNDHKFVRALMVYLGMPNKSVGSSAREAHRQLCLENGTDPDSNLIDNNQEKEKQQKQENQEKKPLEQSHQDTNETIDVLNNRSKMNKKAVLEKMMFWENEEKKKGTAGNRLRKKYDEEITQKGKKVDWTRLALHYEGMVPSKEYHGWENFLMYFTGKNVGEFGLKKMQIYLDQFYDLGEDGLPRPKSPQNKSSKQEPQLTNELLLPDKEEEDDSWLLSDPPPNPIFDDENKDTEQPNDKEMFEAIDQLKQKIEQHEKESNDEESRFVLIGEGKEEQAPTGKEPKKPQHDFTLIGEGKMEQGKQAPDKENKPETETETETKTTTKTENLKEEQETKKKKPKKSGNKRRPNQKPKKKHQYQVNETVALRHFRSAIQKKTYKNLKQAHQFVQYCFDYYSLLSDKNRDKARAALREVWESYRERKDPKFEGLQNKLRELKSLGYMNKKR